MQISELSLASPRIQAYFKGDDSCAPVQELLYIHSHPLIRPNFLAELEGIINATGVKMVKESMSGKPVELFTNMAQRLGGLLPDLNQDNAAEALGVLREAYSLCKKITGIRPPGGR